MSEARIDIWTDAERDALREHYPVLGAQTRIPGRTAAAVTGMAARLGLTVVTSARPERVTKAKADIRARVRDLSHVCGRQYAWRYLYQLADEIAPEGAEL